MTHFLCLPLVTSSSRPHLQATISRFATEVQLQNTILGSSSDTTGEDASKLQIPPAALRPVGVLHFTLGVMSLRNPDQLEGACSFLRELDIRKLLKEAEAGEMDKPDAEAEAGTKNEEAIDVKPSPLKLTLSNLHPMQSPKKTTSLYIAPVDASPALTPFCVNLQTAFRERDLLVSDKRPLRLHATVLNTIYVKGGKRRSKKAPAKIDATQLIEKYKDYEWVKDMRIDRVAICEMGAKRVMEGDEEVDRVYTEVCSVPLP